MLSRRDLHCLFRAIRLGGEYKFPRDEDATRLLAAGLILPGSEPGYFVPTEAGLVRIRGMTWGGVWDTELMYLVAK